jgi:ArsR family transcriptional regulator
MGMGEMTHNTYEGAAALYRSLAHPVRLQILDELRRSEACVCHLQTVLHRPQAYVSQQLRVLREAGIVRDDKDGLLVYYHLSNAHVARILEEILGPADRPARLSNCPCPLCQRASRTQREADLTEAVEQN